VCISWTDKRFDDIKMHGATVKILKYHNPYPVTQLQVSSVGTRNCLAKVQGSKSKANFDHICLRFMRSVRHNTHFIISYEFITMSKK